MSTPRRPDPAFWRNRRVLVTGHTGFKGAWATLWLARMGAHVEGLALEPETTPSLFALANVESQASSHIADLRDAAAVHRVVDCAKPEIVLHMAAQPIVRKSIASPVETIATNVLGTAQLLDALRHSEHVRVILAVTSDKVYANEDAGLAFSEEHALGGKDPYSASKASAEIVVRSFGQTYFKDRGVRVATARGGNVLGGGDYAVDRVVPDIVRAAVQDKMPILRMPDATRPWQHVLDCISGYLLYCETLQNSDSVPHALNFGPLPGRDVTVGALTQMMLSALGRDPSFRYEPAGDNKEMNVLAVDSRRAREALAWHDLLAGEALIAWTADWYKHVAAGHSAQSTTLAQIETYSTLRTSGS
jgi:CDP-glucose 4,6-dehydratase